MLNASFLANMKVITLIYLNCRPDLRDEWLAGSEVEDTTEANVSRSKVRSATYSEITVEPRNCTQETC